MIALDPDAIVAALGGRWRGRHAMVRCPAHPDRSPSLSVTLATHGEVLVYCFGGCSQSAVIAALHERGLWSGRALDGRDRGVIYAPRSMHGSRDDHDRKRLNQARDLWSRALPAKGSLVERYLRSRCITIAPPRSFRFSPSLDHHATGTKWPAMIASIVDRSGTVVAVQRAYLGLDGRGKAPVTPNKMTLGAMGNGAVRFGEPSDIIGLAEGVETALSAKQTYSLPLWAVLGCARFESVAIPSQVRSVIIFADRGDAGWKAAESAADRFKHEGRECEIVLPPVN